MPDPECGSDSECDCEGQGFDCFLWRELTQEEVAALGLLTYVSILP
jgi:hypothetical protein